MTGREGEARVFDGERLRASLFASGGERALFVTFRQWLKVPGAFGEARPVRQARAAGHAHLHIQARLNDWYVNAETHALEAALAPVTARYSVRRAMGFSMGGFGALRLAPVLGLGEVILVSPQLSVDPGLVPWDPRYRMEAAGFDPVLGRLAPLPAGSLSGCLLFDPSRPLDRRNAEGIAAMFPAIALCRLGFGGHPATQVLREGAGIGALTGLLLNGALSRPAVLALHRKARAGSENYARWRARALDARGQRS